MNKLYAFLLLLSFKIFAQTPEVDNSFNIKETGAYQQDIGRDGIVLTNNKILTVFEHHYAFKPLLLNSDGSLDATFNGPGLTPGKIQIYAKSDGNFLTLSADLKLQAFNANGTINTNFTAPAITTLPGNDLKVKDIIYQNDGKIIIIGSFKFINDSYRGNCARLNADGSLDTTFKLDYAATFDAVTMQKDGKYILSGNFSSKLARFDSNGKLDATFKVNTTIDSKSQIVINGFDNSNTSIINDVIIQPDGRIIAVGCNFIADSKTLSYYIVRLNSDGTYDNTFKSLDSENTSVNRAYFQNDGKIIVNVNNNSIIRLNSDGTVDSTFKYSNTLAVTSEATVYFQEDKIIISANFRDDRGITRAGIHRINRDGSLDLTFNPHSGFNVNFNPANDFYTHPTQIKVLANQKILYVGNFTSYNDNAFKDICRITQNGEFDNTFKLDPLVAKNTNAIDNYTILEQKDGKVILLNNDAFLVNGVAKNMLRLNRDGSLDQSFDFDSKGGYVTAVKLLDNGKILIIGLNGEGLFANRDVNNEDKKTYNLIQLNPNGSVDINFKATFNHIPWHLFTLSDNKILLSFQKGNSVDPYSAVLKLNQDGSIDPSFKSGNEYFRNVKELSNGKLLVGINRSLIRINPDGSTDTSFTPYSIDLSKLSDYYYFNENGDINLFVFRDTTNKLTLDSEGKLVNTTIYYASAKFEIQNCQDLVFYGYFSQMRGKFKNGIARFKSPNVSSNPNPLGETFQSFTNGQTLADLKVEGTAIKWYSSQSNCAINNKTTNKSAADTETLLPSTTLLVNGTTYYASQSINGVESSYRLPVTVYSATLGVKENNLPNLVTYPNPVKEYYTISNREDITEVQVYNILGQLQFNRTYNKNSVEIDFTALKSGLYFVKVYSEGKSDTLKVIKN
ncbi:T9SS type A sorting domain-containing protein [Flavobacterium sp. FlaQc-52]|jgi:uncharacterized delta-60 repeat protein|uniref:T9SS type A sorting domain-containing protein n=1 Tax=Flavobacterium sp. FlaQc-52 TaxID=3374185 RepID=UPI003756644A